MEYQLLGWNGQTFIIPICELPVSPGNIELQRLNKLTSKEAKYSMMDTFNFKTNVIQPTKRAKA